MTIQRAIFGALAACILATGASAQELTVEQLAKKADQDFEMKVRLLKPSGEKGAGRDRASFNYTMIPWGVSGDNRFNSLAGLELPVNKVGTSATVAFTRYSQKDPIDVIQCSGGGGMNGGCQPAELTARWGMEVGVKQRLARLGFGDKTGRGVYVEPHLSAGVAPFTMSNSDLKGVELPEYVNTLNTPTLYAAAGAGVNVWNYVTVGLEGRKYGRQKAGDIEKPFMNVVISVSQYGLKALGGLFSGE
jgi:hypothetical protein